MPTGTAFSNCSRTSINSRKSIKKNRIGNDRISPPALQNQRPIFDLIRMMGLWKGDEAYRLNKKDFNHVNSNRICPFFQGIIHWSLSTKAQQKDNPGQSVFFTQTSMIFWIIYAWFPSIAEFSSFGDLFLKTLKTIWFLNSQSRPKWNIS